MPAPERIPSAEVLRSDFVKIVVSAQKSINALEDKFLRPYLLLSRIPPAHEYDYDVAAFCVLAHGVLEYLIEDIALAAIIAIESDWLSMSRLSDPLAATLLHFGNPRESLLRTSTGQGLVPEADDNSGDRRHVPNDIRPRDDIGKALDYAKREISRRVYTNNGIDITNVYLLVLHLGIVVRYQLTEVQASETLTRFRGARAHGSPIYEPTSPSDARTLVAIMFGVFRRIAARVAEKLSRSTQGMPSELTSAG